MIFSNSSRFSDNSHNFSISFAISLIIAISKPCKPVTSISKGSLKFAHIFLNGSKFAQDYQKNQLGLLRAFARFSADHPDHRLVLVGPVTAAAYYEGIAAEAKREGLADKVRIIEGLHPADPMLPSAYKAAEMFALTSLHEPFGIVVLEAWAAGVPVLASRLGGIVDFATDGQTARLVDPENEQALVEGLKELADKIGRAHV